MPQKKENLPVKVDVDLQNGGTITYANEVIATIAGVAANEIDGIAGMCISGGFGEILSRKLPWIFTSSWNMASPSRRLPAKCRKMCERRWKA